MEIPEGSAPPADPPPEVSAFISLIASRTKRPPSAFQQKFIKRMDTIPSVALPEEDTCKAALNLAERGVIGQFTGLWPSPKSVEEWTQRNWKPLIKDGVKSYFVGKGYFVFVFENTEDRSLIFKNGPYFMGPKGLYLNKWTPDFDRSQDVPSAVPVWLRLPHLPLHCWNQKSFQIIGNALGKYIDQAVRKDQYSCTRICVEVDLEEGLPEAIKLTMAGWTHVQELDYEQSPLNVDTATVTDTSQSTVRREQRSNLKKHIGDQWTLVQRTAHAKKDAGKSAPTGARNIPIPTQETVEISKGTEGVQTDPPNKAQENEDHVEAPPSSKEGGVAIQIEASQGSPPNPTYAEVTKKKAVESSESSEEEFFERPLKRAGRKSHKEKREEEAERLKTQGSESTIEMTIKRNSRPRGLGNLAKIETVKDLLKSEPADILLLQETKIAGQALLEISKSKWKKSSGITVSARGSLGGLATLWTEDKYQLIKTHETLHWIFTEIIHLVSKLAISLVNLYVPVNYSEKRDCWNSLPAFLEQETPNNIILAGDLNIVLKAKEKRGGTNSKDPMVVVVEELAQQWDLQDFNPIQGLFTWSNNRTRTEQISARLDRFLVQISLFMNKKIITTKILPKLSSDHKPIQLYLEDEEDLGPIPFRFYPQWIEREGFFETVKAAWASSISSSPSFVWEQKLKLTKKSLKEWMKKPAPNPTSQRVDAVLALHTLQNDMESKTINEDLLDMETKAQRAAFQSFRKEEEYWRLKSRSLWLKAGDRNTSFFHQQCRARLSRNYIAEIKTSEGQTCKGFQQVKEVAQIHFQNLFSLDAQGEEADEAEFLTHIPSLISPKDNSDLCKPVSEEEIIKVIWSMESDKAPGPDEFTIHFYKACWDIIKYDLQKMIRGFLKKAKVGGSTNSTYLALIPKDSNPETFARFRPISLCNASYKILAKLLANRLKPLLPQIISSYQGGFVEGRHILDNVIQVQETVHSSKQRKEKGMLIKLDMANAFDKVNRTFLSKVLLSFGFSPRFVNLIKACTDNPWIAPLINGRPVNFFQAKRGIRQGCPLSPFLYILMAESLSRKLEAERMSGSLPGLKPTNRVNPLNHALFADDSILLGGASTRIAKAFDTIIRNYCKVTGALVNERKSEVFS
eukprot:PITA_04488